jgi:hypothetical protein
MKFRFACVLSVLALALAVTCTAQTDASQYGGPTAMVSGKVADTPSPGRITPGDPMEAGDRPMPATASDGPLVLVGGLVALGMALGFHTATRYFSHS